MELELNNALPFTIVSHPENISTLQRFTMSKRDKRHIGLSSPTAGRQSSLSRHTKTFYGTKEQNWVNCCQKKKEKSPIYFSLS